MVPKSVRLSHLIMCSVTSLNCEKMTAIGSDEWSTIFRSNESEAKLNSVIKFVRDGPERCYKSEFLLEIMSYIVPFRFYPFTHFAFDSFYVWGPLKYLDQFLHKC